MAVAEIIGYGSIALDTGVASSVFSPCKVLQRQSSCCGRLFLRCRSIGGSTASLAAFFGVAENTTEKLGFRASIYGSHAGLWQCF